MRTGRFDLGFSIPLILMLSAFTASGQTRYSMNTVGYFDAQFVAGSNLVANPLDARSNTVSNLFAGVPAGSVYLPWNPAMAGFGPTNRFAGAAGWTEGGAVLDRRAAGFLWLPADATVTFVGEAWSAICVSFPPGPTASGVVPKYACGFCASFTDCLMYPPDFSQVIRWDRANQRFITSEYSIEFGWIPTFPTLAPDEAAMVLNASPQYVVARSFGLPALGQVPLMSPEVVGTNLVFEFSSYEGVAYTVQRSTNPAANIWRTILTNTTTTAGAYIRVTVPMEGESAFYRLHALRLLNPVRTGTQFQFQFYAESGTRYQVSRSPSLENPSWQPVTTVDGTGALMTAIDTSAVGLVAYYRLEY